jgi:uncharacterized membrane-anchored protein
MTDTTASTLRSDLLASKVPQVTAIFWIIKVLSTTVGETAADYLNNGLGLGLHKTSLIAVVVLAIALVVQFLLPRYNPVAYWFTVVLVSVVGTLVTDNLTDGFGFPLALSSVIFAVVLAAVFLVWFRVEGTLSIHSITTKRREAFYWAAILTAFALGTAFGDYLSEALALGYVVAAVMFAAVIALVAVLFGVFKLNAVVAFWIAYVLTRPLGASIGDLLTQPTDAGGLGIDPNLVNGVFFVAIIVLVTVLCVRIGRDRARLRAADAVAA